MGHSQARKRRKGRASQTVITNSGLQIFQKGDQIKSLGGHRWDVASQSAEGESYLVSFAGESPTCERKYHTTGKGCRCKHIAAIEHHILISAEAASGKKIKIGKIELKCPECGGTEFTCDGWYCGKHEKRQRYKCSTCKQRFRDNLGFEYHLVPKTFITLAMMLYGMGLAPANMQTVFKQQEVGYTRTP